MGERHTAAPHTGSTEGPSDPGPAPRETHPHDGGGDRVVRALVVVIVLLGLGVAVLGVRRLGGDTAGAASHDEEVPAALSAPEQQDPSEESGPTVAEVLADEATPTLATGLGGGSTSVPPSGHSGGGGAPGGGSQGGGAQSGGSQGGGSQGGGSQGGGSQGGAAQPQAPMPTTPTSPTTPSTNPPTPPTTPPSTTTTAPPPSTTAPPRPTVSVSGAPSSWDCDTQGSEVTLSWSTTDATSVTVSIDDPSGAYQTGLPANGSLAVPAPCTSGDTQTYYVRAIGPNGSTSVSRVTTGA